MKSFAEIFGIRIDGKELTPREELNSCISAKIPILTYIENEVLFQNTCEVVFLVIKGIDEIHPAEQCRFNLLLKDRKYLGRFMDKTYEHEKLPENCSIVFLAKNLDSKYYTKEFLSLVVKINEIFL